MIGPSASVGCTCAFPFGLRICPVRHPEQRMSLGFKSWVPGDSIEFEVRSSTATMRDTLRSQNHLWHYGDSWEELGFEIAPYAEYQGGDGPVFHRVFTRVSDGKGELRPIPDERLIRDITTWMQRLRTKGE